MPRKLLEYNGLKFTSRQALEWYLTEVCNKTYEEARTISGNVPTIEAEPIPVKSKVKARGKKRG